MIKLLMHPSPGERRVAFVGDYIKFRLKFENGIPHEPGWRAFVRTNLGRAAVRRQEIISAYFQKIKLFGASWHDIPMYAEGDEWVAQVPLCEVGYFKAKAYVRDPRGWQHWPEGPDFGVNVHPNSCRTGNIIYCAFTRLFGEAKYLVKARDENAENSLKPLDSRGFTVIPPSGKLRDLKREIPHIMDVLGCKIVHLLPINPTPTTFARFGRFGSPYAALDLTGIDHALVEFDKKTNAVDQFKELAYEIHKRGGLIFLDVVVNHTGWGAYLFNNHPEWYKRLPDGTFESPGAWGIIWEDLVELDQKYPELWEYFADAFLKWCERGVDGFRCDAGYKIPVNVWQYIVARVQEEFPETIFLLEGLGGAWESTEDLLTEGGMQWAYSELFQNYSPIQISGYLDHAIKQSSRVGILVHYSETHDNNRLAVKGKNWSLVRNRLCALSSVSGGFGFTCGVEWLATEKINVHHLSGLNWGASENIVSELATLNKLLSNHPCFFDNAQIYRISPHDSHILVLLRISYDDKDSVLVIINSDHENSHELTISKNSLGQFSERFAAILSSPVNLLGQSLPQIEFIDNHTIRLSLKPGETFCISDTLQPKGLSGDLYRKLRACAAFGFEAMKSVVPPETIGFYDWKMLGSEIYKDPFSFLSKLKPGLNSEQTGKVKRVRVWVNADGFLSPLNYDNLVEFIPGNPSKWRFIANSGDGRAVEICLTAWMVTGKNTTVIQLCRSPYRPEIGKELPPECDVRLTVRFDIEDRNFHWVTKRNEGADYHFSSNCRQTIYTVGDKQFFGFEFTPSAERQLRVLSSGGVYHPSPEWSINIPHPVEQTRGLEPNGDSYSPGWFEIPILQGETVTLIATAETKKPYFDISDIAPKPTQRIKVLDSVLTNSAATFVVRRGKSKTIIAGYPWFLDWGRDTLIAARGLLSAGMFETTLEILRTFAKFEENGTLPNAIFGENTSNRDTSDAPLWFALLCEEFAEAQEQNPLLPDIPVYDLKTENGRKILEVLVSIAENYIRGTQNGIKMDEDSGLIFSPSHFTWMDTNYPACTPREGYPVEIQALWIRLLKQLARLGVKRNGPSYDEIGKKAENSFHSLFWLEREGWYSDVLICQHNTPAKSATKDHALRSNCLLAICLGIVSGIRAQKCVEAAQNYLIVPGALRSLAPLRVEPPLFIKAPDGRLLNNPEYPYWGRYEGDEDTRRKPAYHNGTAWVWTFPHFCEALVRAWDFHPEAVKAAKSYLTSVKDLIENGCIGHLPEIVDGDAPHTQRGCDAQAWSVTEFLRVLKLIQSAENSGI